MCKDEPSKPDEDEGGGCGCNGTGPGASVLGLVLLSLLGRLGARRSATRVR